MDCRSKWDKAESPDLCHPPPKMRLISSPLSKPHSPAAKDASCCRLRAFVLRASCRDCTKRSHAPSLFSHCTTGNSYKHHDNKRESRENEPHLIIISNLLVYM